MTNKTVSRLAVAFLCVVGFALLMFIGFMVIIVIACGQYKPPVQEEEDYVVPEDSLCYYIEEPVEEETVTADFSQVEAE